MSTITHFGTDKWEERYIRQHSNAPEGDVAFMENPLDEQHIPDNAEQIEAASIFVDSEITPEVIAAFPRLRFITTRSTGYDHIDIDAAKDRDIAVANVPGYGSNTVAEFAFGLLLNLTRNIYRAVNQVKEEENLSVKGLRGMDVKGKTIGIVGTGAIGSEMARIAYGFGMSIIASDPSPDTALTDRYGVEYVELEDLLARADVITLHCPLTEGTRHLINSDNIDTVKEGAYLINCARGAVVETQALVQALHEGRLSGAGIDVLEEEEDISDELAYLQEGDPHVDELQTLIRNHMLMHMPNVLVTPHLAFNSEEAMQRILDTTLENIRGFQAGEPRNLVT